MYRSTRAEAGNLRAGTVTRVTDSAHNRAFLANFGQIQNAVVAANPMDAAGGRAAESLDHTIGRAIESIGQPQRAVTLFDYEILTKQIPGVEVARATAWADTYPSFPCPKAPGRHYRGGDPGCAGSPASTQQSHVKRRSGLFGPAENHRHAR